MAVNHGGTLGKEYFISYLSLIMNSRGCSAQQAKETAFNLFFGSNVDRYGEETYQEFLSAYSLLKEAG